MSEFSWQSWGVLPLFLSKKQFRGIVGSNKWKHWASGSNSSDIKDVRRFYTRSSADVFRPVEGGRYVAEVEGEQSPFFTLNFDTARQENPKQVEVKKLQLLFLGETCLLYIHFDSNDQFDEVEVATLNRMAFQWEPRSERHQVCQWLNVAKQEKSLKAHITDFLSITLNDDCHYGEDIFGHELANCVWIKQLHGEEHQSGLCVSELSAGLDMKNPRYKLSDVEKEKLITKQFNYWADWRCQFNLNRLVFLDHTPGESSLKWNLSTHNFYLDLFGAVVSQKVSLNKFKDEMIMGKQNKKGKLFERITCFRQDYKISHISTYPFAEKLYRYLCQQADLESIEEKAFIELEHNHALWKQEKEESSNSVLLLVSLIAALLVPASSIATIMALTEEQMNDVFWATSGVFTGITALAILWPLGRHLYKRFKKEQI